MNNNYNLLFKDKYYALYQHKHTFLYTYRCPGNDDVIYCKDSIKPVIIDSIKKHIKLKYKDLQVFEYMGKESEWCKEINERIKSLYKLLEVIEQ